MRKVSKILLLIFCFYFITFSMTDNAETLCAEKSNNNNDIGTNAAVDSLTLDRNKEVNECENFLAKNTKCYCDRIEESLGKQLIIEAIKKGLESKQTIINLDKYIRYFKNKSEYKIPMEYYYNTLNKYPEIFYSDVKVDCDAIYDKSTNEITSYNLLVNYPYDNATIDIMKTKFNKKLQDIKNNYLSKSKTDLEKEYIIHDYIIENCVYDKENYYKNTVPAIEHTAYGALVNGTAVCDGYARAAQLLFRDSNIKSDVVVSESMNHAWNVVLIDGYYYFLDITWDDSEANEKGVVYKYFNVTSSELKSGIIPHVWDALQFPICFNDKFSFLKNGRKIKRVKDKLYYPDIKTRTYSTYSLDLDGGNETLFNNSDYTFNIQADKNNLYCLNFSSDSSDNITYYLYKFDPLSKKEELMFKVIGSVEDMYIKGTNLIIEYTEGGVKKRKTIGISL